MKLNEREIEMFNALSKSETGKTLVEYLKRLSDFVCDVRQMKEGDTKESVVKASSIIEAHIINKIRPDQKSNKAGGSNFE